MTPEWELWWCCLSDGWRSMFNLLGILAPPALNYYLREAYDLFFTLNIAPTDSWLYDYFNDSFGITFAELEIEPGVTINVAYWDILNYASFQIWRFDPKYECPTPCPFTSPPFAL